MESQSASARHFKRKVTFGQWTFWSAKTTHEYAYWRGVESMFRANSSTARECVVMVGGSGMWGPHWCRGKQLLAVDPAAP